MKSSKSRSDTAVQGTNDNSVVSKWSISHAGYTRDDHLQHFIGKKSRRSPLINRGYYIRAKAVQHAIDKFLHFHSSTGAKCQVISLGAGFDSAYFRLKSENMLNRCFYVEVDFPAVVRRKHSLIKQSIGLISLLSERQKVDGDNCAIELLTNDYALIGADLTRLDMLNTYLTRVGVDMSAPTLLLSEVVLTYMKTQHADAVITWASRRFDDAMFVSYEQLHPDDAFGKVMMQHFTKLGSPLRCIDTYPCLGDQLARFTSLGWHQCAAVDMNYFYRQYVSDAEKRRVDGLEPFDEFEEWTLKCAHYTLITAVTTQSTLKLSDIWATTVTDCENESETKSDSCGDMHEALLRAQDTDMLNTQVPIDVQLFNDGQCGLATRYTQASINSPGTLPETTRYAADSKAVLSHLEDQFVIKPQHVVTPSRDSPLQHNCVRRFGHRVCLLENDNLLLVGGFGDYKNRHQRLADLTCFNIRTNKCYRLKHINDPDLKATDCDTNPVPITNCVQPSSSVQGFDLMYSTVNRLSDNRVVIVGGRRSPLRPNSDVLVLSIDVTTFSQSDMTEREIPQCDDITQQTCDQQTNEPTMGYKLQQFALDDNILPRWRHSACVVTWQGIELLVVYGGRTADQRTASDCFVLNTSDMTWHQVKLSSTATLHSHHASVWRNCCVISGGLDLHQLPSRDIYMLDINKDSDDAFLGRLRKVELRNQIIGRFSHTSVVHNDRLLLIGGVCLRHPASDVTAVDLVSGAVQQYCFKLPCTSTVWMLHNHDSVLTRGDDDGDEVVVLGGGGNCFSFGTHLNEHLLKWTLSDEQ